MIFSTIYGFIRFPPFATAVMPQICCKAVILKFCPNEATARSVSVNGSKNILFASPGRSTPVFSE